jgi:hypothetical protein
VQTLILTASAIQRDSIAARVPDQNSRMSWRKAAARPDVDTAFGLVLIRGAILDGYAGLTYATLQSLMSTSSL